MDVNTNDLLLSLIGLDHRSTIPPLDDFFVRRLTERLLGRLDSGRVELPESVGPSGAIPSHDADALCDAHPGRDVRSILFSPLIRLAD